MTENTFDPNNLNTDSLILWFDDLGTGNEEFRFLSNFYEGAPITLPGVTWEAAAAACGPLADASGFPDGLIPFRTGEHAFAAMKFWGSDFSHFAEIVLSAVDPNTAKALGRSRRHPLRADWEEVKLDVMAAVTRAKYAVGREEADRLLNTGDKLLCEFTFWGDTVWGVDGNSETGEGLWPGRNWLGTLLMSRRAELRAARHFKDSTAVQNLSQVTGFWNTRFATESFI